MDSLEKRAREVGLAMFGVGFFLPLLTGGNSLFALEPADALTYWAFVVLGATLIVSRRSARADRVESAVDWSFPCLIAFLLWWTAAMLFRPHGPRVPMETAALLTGVLLYVRVSGSSLSPEFTEKLVIGAVLGTIATAIYAQYQYWVAFPKVIPTLRSWGIDARPFVNANFYNANAYAGFLGGMVLLVTGLAPDSRFAALRRTAFWALPILLVTLLLTRSRASVALLCFALLAREAWIAQGIGRRSTRGWRAAAAAAALIAGIAALAARADLTEFWAVGWGGRLAIWRASWAMIRDHWALGVGLGRFAEFFPSYQITHYYTRYAHSFVLEVFAELGLVGGLSMAGFLATSFAGAFARLRTATTDTGQRRLIIAAASGAGFLVAHAAVDIDWHAPADVVLLFILLGLMRAKWSEAGDRAA